jgi:HK97 family phage major capsid protein
MLERRSAITAEMRTINDAPAGEGGDLSDAQEARFGELKAELETLEKRIERQQHLDSIERRVAGAPADRGSDYATELRGYSLTRAIAGAAGLNVDDGREREIAQEVRRREGRDFEGIAVPLEALAPERRTVAVTAPGTGGAMVETEIAGQVIDALRAQMVTSRLGVTMLSGLRGNLDIPKITTSAAADWFPEGGQITEADPSFGTVSLRPKHVGALSAYSRNMLIQSSPDVEAVMRRDMAASLANALDAAILIGGGADQPVGVGATSGINTLASAAVGTIDHNDVIDLITLILADNSGVTGLAMSPTAAAVLKKLEDGDGRPLGILTGFGGNSVFDGTFPAAVTTAMPALAASAIAVLAGRWSDVLVGMWGGLDVLVNPYSEAHYTRGAVGVRAIMTADVKVRHAVSFGSLTVKAS